MSVVESRSSGPDVSKAIGWIKQEMEDKTEEKHETKEKDTKKMSLPAVEEEPDLPEFPITEPAESRQESNEETG